MKLKRARLCWAFCFFAGATSGCEPADFLAPSGEDAVEAALSALKTFPGAMPNTVRFEGFSPTVERQLVDAVRSFASLEWKEPTFEDRVTYGERAFELELRLQEQRDSGYLFGYLTLGFARPVGRESGGGSYTFGTVTTDRVGGRWESVRSFPSFACMRGGPRMTGPWLTRWIRRLQREAISSPNTVVLHPYDVALQ